MWWFYDIGEHIWQIDKSGAHIHWTIKETVTRVWGKLGTTKAVKVAMEHLLFDVNQPKFRKEMVGDCATAFLDRGFKRKLNSNMSLVGCKNGVYDFNLRKLCCGRPTDYITMLTRRNFVDGDIEWSSELRKFFSDVLVDDGVINCVLAAWCLSLRGVPSQNFWMWCGKGANGKSKVASLFRRASGDYTVNLPVQVVTSKRIENGKPMPEMSRTAHTRDVFISEPCPNELLNAGAIKEMTGGDSMYTRGLYSDGGEMTCNFCPILQCNDKPNCTDNSDGMARRPKVVEFPVQFKEFPDPKKYPYEKKLDNTIDALIEAQADMFMTYCLTAGYEYAEEHGIQYSKSMTDTTNEYRVDCDWVTQFKQEFIVKTDNEKDVLMWNTVLSAATSYYKAHHTGRLPRVVDLRKLFETALGQKLHNWRWKGWLMPVSNTAGF